MENQYNILFRLKSSNNEYLINIQIIKDFKQLKLEISLTHKLIEGDIKFLLQSSKEELIKENNFLSKFSTIQDIFNYFIKIIKEQQIKILKPTTSYYYINFYDTNEKKNFQILLPKKVEDNIKEIVELKRMIEDQKKLLIELHSEIEKISAIEKKDKYEKIGICVDIDETIHNSCLSNFNQSISGIKDNYILKDNNNNISFNKLPCDFNNEIIISEEKDHCEYFTAFTSMNGNNVVVWTIKGKGLINLYNFEKETKQNIGAHMKTINCVQYFYVSQTNIEYIISLSQEDVSIFKLWKIDNECKLILQKEFYKSDFKKNIEIFCTFNCKEYDNENSFFFFYGKHFYNNKNNNYNFNSNINKEIFCYKLDNNLNIINWKKNDGNEINYEIINNFYKINYLDTFYDFKNGNLYLININEKEVEVITELFDHNRGIIYNYKNWGFYLNAYIKEINGVLKLFVICIKGIIIWNIDNNVMPESFLEINDYCPIDFLSWNDKILILSGDKKFEILWLADNKLNRKNQKNKKTGYTKIRKINSPKGKELIVAIDDYKVKCWLF